MLRALEHHVHAMQQEHHVHEKKLRAEEEQHVQHLQHLENMSKQLCKQAKMVNSGEQAQIAEAVQYMFGV